MTVLRAVPADSPSARIRAYHVDCSSLLDRWELMARAAQRNREPGVIACNARPLIDGKTLEIRVADWQSFDGRAPKRPHIAVITNRGLLDLWISGFADAAAGATLDLDVETSRNGMQPVVKKAEPARQFPLR